MAVAFFAQSKKLTQRERGRERAQPDPDSASTYATLVAVASQFLYRLYSIHTYVFHFLLLAESRMAPSTWSGATSRGWSSTTSPTSIRASTSAARRATSMARSVSPYPIRSRCKLWVSAVYSYVLCTCCCRGGREVEADEVYHKVATPQNMTATATVAKASTVEENSSERQLKRTVNSLTKVATARRANTLHLTRT